MVVLLCLGMVIAYVDRTAFSVAIAVPDSESLRLTDSQRGLMNSAFFWSYALYRCPRDGWSTESA